MKVTKSKNEAETVEKRFIEFMTDAAKVNGLDDLTCRILANLYIEPGELSLEEISERLGYSLSAISTTMKFIERMGLVKRIKKPKSRKAYFYMEKDILEQANQMMKRKYEKIILVAKDKLPQIIEDYKKLKNKNIEKMDIFEKYYENILKFEKILDKVYGRLE